MTTNRFNAALALTLLGSLALPLRADQLTIDVTGIENISGMLMVDVYNDAEAWSKSGEAVASARQAVTAGTARVVFADLQPGMHAVMLYQDQNSNGKLDSNMLGIPSEGFGFSNNGGRLGKPPFEKAQVMVEGETTIEISLR